MEFIKTPVKGMPEQLPLDMELREYAMAKIKDTYRRFGFSLIETPAIEHIENLTNKQGGENEMLIFRILKRGEKLEKSTDINDMCDCGLRYDLTVPLTRFFANNMNALPYPFKALQIGSSWRADRPQKGRFRQFTQCDIDIIGDGSNLAEIELISATSEMLYQLGMGNFVVRVNDRRILRAMALHYKFPEEKLDDIYIALDKIDKIGADGVKSILLQMGLNADDVEQYIQLFSGEIHYDSCTEFLGTRFTDTLSPEIIQNMDEIIQCVRKIIASKGRVVFDPTLVRGMSYYTGPIFEIELTDKSDMSLSIAGGGRYDKMIGNYYNGKIAAPACGFSIGFERIISILKSSGKHFSADNKEPVAYLINSGVSTNCLEKVFVDANTLRDQGIRVQVSPKQKNLKVQIDKLLEQGYKRFYEVSESNTKEINVK